MSESKTPPAQSIAPAPAPGGSRIRKLVLDKVRTLGTTEHEEIFRMLRAHGIAHSSNSNGVFINLSVVPDDVLAKVKAFVDYCAANKKELDEYDKRLHECKITHRYDRITHQPTDGVGVCCTTTDAGSTASNEPAAEVPPPAPAPAPARPLSTASSLINGRFQSARKRFSRRKIVDRKHGGEGATDRRECGALTPEAYTYVHPAREGVTA